MIVEEKDALAVETMPEEEVETIQCSTEEIVIEEECIDNFTELVCSSPKPIKKNEMNELPVSDNDQKSISQSVDDELCGISEQCGK